MTDHLDDIADLVRTRIEKLGLSLAKVSIDVGKNRAYLHQYLERRIPRQLPADVRSQLARAIGVEESELAPPGTDLTVPKRQDVRPRSQAMTVGAPQDPGADIPLMGTVYGSEEASDFLFNGEAIDYIRCPPPLVRAKNCFALRVLGESMRPRFEPRNLVIVQSGISPSVNDYVVVELRGAEGTAGPAFLKRLIAYAGDHIVCEQYNPQARLEFKLSTIKMLYRVVTLEEIVGVA
jgi:phage repressor protein C with HTH and peptisase S24 domain